MAAWRMRPPNVRQSKLTCWAAAISSFARVTGGVTNWMKVDDVVDEFSTWTPTVVNADRTLKTPRGWKQFAKRFDLEVVEILIQRAKVTPSGGVRYVSPAPTRGVSHIRTRDLELRHFSERLRSSHVIVVMPPAPDDPDGPSHTVVVYGADNRRVYYMDPNAPWESDGLRERAGYDEFGQGGVGAERYMLIWKS